MLPILGAIAAGILIALVVMATGLDHSERRRVLDYQARRRRIVEQIDGLSGEIARLVSKINLVNDRGLALAGVEKIVATFELIVTAFSRLAAFGSDPGQLDSAEILVKDCANRVVDLEVRLGLRSPAVATRIARFIGRGIRRQSPASASGPGRGCYFCSRPFYLDLENFAQVKVKIDRVTHEVFSCGPCKDSLEETKKIKVLYFLSEGQPTHWSQVSGYIPSEEYWNLNRPKPEADRKLRLVTTADDSGQLD